MSLRDYLFHEEPGITLYCGDCREVLPLLDRADALVTDPPYGIEFTGKVTKHTDNRGSVSYEDTPAYFHEVVLPAIEKGLTHVDRAAVFSGITRLFDYPRPADIGGIICPNGGGRSKWGFGCFHPVLFYGTSPYMAKGLGARPTAAAIYHPGMHVTGEAYDHPCPKPIQFMFWAVSAASLDGELVLDPFAGTGSTIFAAKELHRRAIGIEIEPKYCEIAVKRLRQEVLPFRDLEPVGDPGRLL